MTGQKFGRLTVLERAENISSQVAWLCECDCGNKKVVTTSHLRSGHTKSCGCLQKDKAKETNFINLIGQRFGMLEVIKDAEQYISSQGLKYTQWLCKCDCGNETIVTTHNLRSGNTKSCGCYSKMCTSKRNFKDLTGKKFGSLRVIKVVENQTETMTKWLCECDCGNECIVQSGNLISGHTKSCGCYNKKCVSERSLKNLIGLRFGKLTVLERADDKVENLRNKSVKWKCRCDCGNETIVTSKVLLQGYTKSCGCITSLGEHNLLTYLITNNIEYEYQKRFDDCRGLGGNLLSYDFYLPQYNLLIECQGEQHYRPITHFGGEKQFNIQQEHDKRKREYAKKNGFHLLEINHKDYNYINEIIEEKLIYKQEEF